MSRKTTSCVLTPNQRVDIPHHFISNPNMHTPTPPLTPLLTPIQLSKTITPSSSKLPSQLSKTITPSRSKSPQPRQITPSQSKSPQPRQITPSQSSETSPFTSPPDIRSTPITILKTQWTDNAIYCVNEEITYIHKLLFLYTKTMLPNQTYKLKSQIWKIVDPILFQIITLQRTNKTLAKYHNSRRLLNNLFATSTAILTLYECLSDVIFNDHYGKYKYKYKKFLVLNGCIATHRMMELIVIPYIILYKQDVFQISKTLIEDYHKILNVVFSLSKKYNNMFSMYIVENIMYDFIFDYESRIYDTCKFASNIFRTIILKLIC
jgi:hypothetical protein